MNDLELQDTSSDAKSTTLIESNKIVSVNISLNHIKENGNLYLSGTVTGVGSPNVVIVNKIEVYINGTISSTNSTGWQGSGTVKLGDIGVSNASYNSTHTSISVYIVAHGYNDVTSNTVTKNLPTADNLSKEFIDNEGLDENVNKYRLGIRPAGNNWSNSFLEEGSIYYTIDGSDPSDSSNSNRQLYKDNIRILIPNSAGTYTVRAYHIVGNVSAELESYTFTIDSEMYDAPTISFDNTTNLITFSNFPTNVSDNVVLLLQYEIYYNDGTNEPINLNIGSNTSLQTIVSKSGKVRCRIVDNRGESYGCSSWSAYESFTISLTKYDLPPVSVDFDNYVISFSNIPSNTYLYINVYYNDDTEEVKQKIEGDNDGKYSFTYTKGGKFKYYIVDKSGYDVGHSDWSDYVNFTIKGETIPELYNTPTLSLGSDNNVIISNIASGYKVEYTIIYDYDNDGVVETTKEYSSTDYENSINVPIGKYLGKIRARLVNLNGASVGASEWSDYLNFNFTDSTPDPEPEITIKTPIINTEEVKVGDTTKIKVIFIRDSSETNLYTKVYYTTDSSVPNTNSNLATIGEEFYITPSSNNFYIKYKAYYEVDGKSYWSNIGYVSINISDTPDPDPDTDKDNTNNPFYYGYTKPSLNNKVVKNYIDIIYSINPEDTKSLESIQYILDEIKAPFGTINLAEQAFNKLSNHKDGRFSGDSIVLYSDETYSGEININDQGDNNVMDNYKYPSFQKGHWEFNYFRNNGTQLITDDELNKIYTNIPYVDSNGKTIITTITLNDLYKSFGITSTESSIALRSDNRSLIYGKYIVARFIFNNDKKIKLQNVTFITNNY